MATEMSDQGAMLVFDLLCSGDRAQLTMPVVSDGGWPDRIHTMRFLVEAAESDLMPLLVNCLVDECSVVGIEAQSMMLGDVPYRKNFGEGANAGLNAGMPLPMSNGGKILFYFDPADVSPGNKTKVSHNTIPGLPEGDVTGKTIDPVIVTAMQAFAQKLVDGLVDTGSGLTWKRANHFVKAAVAESIRVAVLAIAEQVVGSVRRRLLP